MKLLRKILTVVLLPLNVIAAMMSLVAACAQFVSPTAMMIPPLLGLAFPIVMLVNVLFLAAWAMMRSIYILLPVGTLLACSWAMWQYSPIHMGGDNYISDNRPGFSLLSYNVYHFVEADKTITPPDYNRTLQTVLNYDADLVVLQEAPYPTVSRNRRFTEGQIAQMERQYPYRARCARSCILSKYPIEHITDTILSNSATVQVARATIEGRQVTIINNHLQSIGLDDDDKAMYRELTENPDSIKSKVGNIKQMARKFVNAFETRAQQVHYVDSLARATGGNLIICGDINDTPNSYAYRVLRGERHDAYMRHGCGPGYTYRSNRMWVRIDHVIYQGNFASRYLQLGKERTSDHFPLFVRFDWE